MYKLDLAAMVQILHEFRQNGILQTEIRNVRGLKGPLQVQLDLADGEIISCMIQDSHGQILYTNNDALSLLADLGPLDWTLTLKQSIPQVSITDTYLSVPPLHPPPITRPRIPRRAIHLNQAQMNSWPRKHRMVYVLVDGQKTIENIALMLSLTPDAVEEVLHELQSIHVIHWD